VSDIQLQVESQGNYFRVTWNRQAPIVASATGGILVVYDGDRTPRELPLSASLLQSGSVLYEPTNKRVRFRLDLTSVQSATAISAAPPTSNQNPAAAQEHITRAVETAKPHVEQSSTTVPSRKSDADNLIVQEPDTRARRSALQSDKVLNREVTGIATFYGSSRPSNKDELAAAYARLPIGSHVRVTNLRNGRSIVVQIVKRGASARGEHIINLSYRAAEELGFVRAGTAPVRVSPELTLENPAFPSPPPLQK
jgi:rare lipoprotein A (peptidoglycan hydrolase)